MLDTNDLPGLRRINSDPNEPDDEWFDVEFDEPKEPRIIPPSPVFISASIIRDCSDDEWEAIEEQLRGF